MLGVERRERIENPGVAYVNLPDFNENWLELSAKAGATDFAFITRKG